MRYALSLALLVAMSWVGAQEATIPDAQAGTLYPFLQSQVPAQFPLSFTNPRFTDLERWKSQARATVKCLLHYDPPKCDPKPEVLEREDCGDYVREKLTFSTTPDIRVPAYVLIPKDDVKRHPAVLLLHDHGAFFAWGKEKVIALPNEHPSLTEFKRTAYSGRSVGNELVKRGYVVMAIDMFYWGERRMILPGDPPEYQDRERMSVEQVADFNRRAGQLLPQTAIGVFEAGTTWAGVMFTDDMRSVDYLASRSDVDPDRIGCCGLSVGGFRSAHLAGLDPRIKAAVAVGWMCSYPAMLQKKLSSIGFWAVVPGLQQLMDLPDVASMHAPQPLMCIQGTRDGLFTNEGVQAAYDKIAVVYAKAGVRTRFRPVTYDGPHEFNAQMQDKAYAWLDRWLKGRE
ncbi:MAG: alpha/beta hydrolase family protein [Armatimonadetes bacterium]|nr:alpha/beta hydrolase family protein [Armatimonadota bacterium]